MLRLLVLALLLSLSSSFFVPSAPFALPSSSLSASVKLVNSAGKSCNVAEGSKMSAACSKLGIKPKYSCKK